MKFFFDTNILCYAIDERKPDKQATAENILHSHFPTEIFISTQVLQELFNVATTKLHRSKADAKNIVNAVANYNVVQVTVNTIFSAIDICTRYQFSIWDSLILASAIETGCNTLYTEDLNNGQVVEGVKIVNPFVV